MRIWVTGTAGFIGFHLARRLLDDGHFVTGIDGFTTYYDVRLKEARHALLARSNGFRPIRLMLEDAEGLAKLGQEDTPEVIVHLAAQAGVRYSLENPRAYVDANLTGLFNVMEVAREAKVQHFLFASTSSVYGANASVPFRETDRADHPMTLYAATKKAGEGMAHSYAHLWQIPTTCFRFFTVYGPWGRPDMALFKFVDAIEAGRPIEVYGEGRMERDFTYVEDLVEGITRLMSLAPAPGQVDETLDSLSPVAPHRGPADAADAAGRRAAHLRQRRSPGGADGLSAGHSSRGRRQGFRAVVPGVEKRRACLGLSRFFRTCLHVEFEAALILLQKSKINRGGSHAKLLSA